MIPPFDDNPKNNLPYPEANSNFKEEDEEVNEIYKNTMNEASPESPRDHKFKASTMNSNLQSEKIDDLIHKPEVKSIDESIEVVKIEQQPEDIDIWEQAVKEYKAPLKIIKKVELEQDLIDSWLEAEKELKWSLPGNKSVEVEPKSDKINNWWQLDEKLDQHLDQQEFKDLVQAEEAEALGLNEQLSELDKSQSDGEDSVLNELLDTLEAKKPADDPKKLPKVE